MSTSSNFVWVNKTRDSSSLTNCRKEKGIFSQIRSHAVAVGHKSSRIKRPIKRTPLNLSWARRNFTKGPTNNLRLQPASQKRGDNDPLPHGETLLQTKVKVTSLGMHLKIHRLSGIPDPFSSYTIELDCATLGHLWYFENIWTQSAFKLPGCVGYGQEPIEQFEVTAMIQQCLADKTRSYCLLAATSARVEYIHHQETRNGSSGLSHSYAARALHGLGQRMHDQNKFSEEDSIDVVFLAAYEVFCSDELGAEKHLVAVRRLYTQEISNNFGRRLQANLENLVAKSLAGRQEKATDLSMQLR